MKKIFILLLVSIAVLNVKEAKSQSLPSGACGIVYTYDAAGNRTGYSYLCNNSATAVDKNNQLAVANKQATDTEQVIQVDVLYPNPTTGHITVKLVKPLQNADVQLIDMAGRIVFTAKATGLVLNYNLQKEPAGVYILHIQYVGQQISMKIIKR